MSTDPSNARIEPTHQAIRQWKIAKNPLPFFFCTQRAIAKRETRKMRGWVHEAVSAYIFRSENRFSGHVETLLLLRKQQNTPISRGVLLFSE